MTKLGRKVVKAVNQLFYFFFFFTPQITTTFKRKRKKYFRDSNHAEGYFFLILNKNFQNHLNGNKVESQQKTERTLSNDLIIVQKQKKNVPETYQFISEFPFLRTSCF